MSFLSFPKTVRVLDAGCGPGGLFALLLEALGPSGALVAIDRSTPHLAVAKKLITSQALEQRVQLAQLDLESTLPYPDGSFDGVWSADVITPDDFADIPSVVSELFRVLKPGGSLFLFYGNWLRQQLLPGHSRLEHLISIAKEFAYARDRAWEGNARNDGFGKQAVYLPCSDSSPCLTTSHCFRMSTDFSRTVPWAPFTTRRFRNSAPGSG